MAIFLCIQDATISFQVDTCREFSYVTIPGWLTPTKQDGGNDPVSQQTMASSCGTLVHT
jgi:hypothetical protein